MTDFLPPAVQALRDALGPMDDVAYRGVGDHRTGYEAIVIFSLSLCTEREVTTWMTSEHVRHMIVQGHDAPFPKPLIVRSEQPHPLPKLMEDLLRGCILLYVVHSDVFYAFSLRTSSTQRLPSDSSMDVSIRGPRDGFVEDIETNIALVRRRLPKPTLKCQYMTIGIDTTTKVALLYLEHKIDPGVLTTVCERLRRAQPQRIIASQQIEVALERRGLFPKFCYTGRPDLVAQGLLQGQFALIVDGNPSVSLAPVTLAQTVRASEDAHFSRLWFNPISYGLRWFGLCISILLPGAWVSLVAYHQEQLPFSLLATVTISRSGLPFSAILEMYVLLLLFELLREAGIRLPQHIGQTLTVVGGIIIGDAAIRSGLASPSLVVIAAATAVGTFTLANQDVVATCSWLRWSMLSMASLFGFFGLFVSLFVALIHICAQTSFGVPLAGALATWGSQASLSKSNEKEVSLR